MNLIVAVDKNWAIGYRNKLLVSIPEDMKFFREITTNMVVVMGQNTLESFKNSRPLKDRVNIVISDDLDYQVKDAVVMHSIKETMTELEKYNTETVFVIGCASIYKQMLKYCDTAYVTYIDHEYSADTYFPNLEECEEWEMTEVSEEQTYFDLEYYFRKYKNKKFA